MQREMERVRRSAQGQVQRALDEKSRAEAESASLKEAVRTVASRCGFPGLQRFDAETLLFLAERVLVLHNSVQRSCGTYLQVADIRISP